MSQYHIPCPYAGLQPYTEQESEYFFGREEDQETIAANLLTAPLTIAYGGSGVGKTSLLLAGVVPFVRKLPGVLIISFREWQDRTFLIELKECVARAVAERTGQPFSAADLPLDELLYLATNETQCTLAIVLDQFEEYFLYHPEFDAANHFDAELACAINRVDVDANFLLSMREDSLALLDRFQKRISNLFDNYIRIERLSLSAARDAVVKPIERYNEVNNTNIWIEPELVDNVLSQISSGHVALGAGGRGVVRSVIDEDGAADKVEAPYLQLVMTRLWDEEMSASSTVLRRATLDQLGGAEQIAETHLDDKMDKLSKDGQDIMVRIFRHLVTPGGTKIALGLDDLAGYAKVDQVQLKPVLDKQADQNWRILRSVAPAQDRPTESRYEIFHDVLAPAILRWCQKREQEEFARQACLAAESAAHEINRRRLRVAGLVALIFVLVVAALLLSASMEKTRELKKVQIENLVLQQKLEKARDELAEHLVYVHVPRVLLVFIPNNQNTIAVFPLTDDPDLKLMLARGFVRRGILCARQSAHGLDDELAEQTPTASGCPLGKQPLEQALADLQTALEIAQDSDQHISDQIWEEFNLHNGGRYVPAAVVAFERAREYARQEDTYDEAVEAVEEAFKLQPSLRSAKPEPDLAKAFGAKAETIFIAGEYDKAQDYLNRELQLDESSRAAIATTWRRFGEQYAQECRIDRALQAFEQASVVDLGQKFDPQIAVRNAVRKRSQELGARVDASAPEVDEALALGRVCAFQGEADIALDAFQLASKLDPELDMRPIAQLCVDFARQHIQKDQTETALDLFRLAVELAPRLRLSPELEVALERGRHYARQGKAEEAVEALQSAKVISPALQLAEPDVAGALISRATTAASQEQPYDVVLTYLRLAAWSNPSGQAEVARRCVDLKNRYRTLGQDQAADEALRLAQELDPMLLIIQPLDG